MPDILCQTPGVLRVARIPQENTSQVPVIRLLAAGSRLRAMKMSSRNRSGRVHHTIERLQLLYVRCTALCRGKDPQAEGVQGAAPRLVIEARIPACPAKPRVAPLHCADLRSLLELALAAIARFRP